MSRLRNAPLRLFTQNDFENRIRYWMPGIKEHQAHHAMRVIAAEMTRHLVEHGSLRLLGIFTLRKIWLPPRRLVNVGLGIDTEFLGCWMIKVYPSANFTKYVLEKLPPPRYRVVGTWPKPESFYRIVQARRRAEALADKARLDAIRAERAAQGLSTNLAFMRGSGRKRKT